MECAVWMRMCFSSMEVVRHELGHHLPVMLEQCFQMSWVENNKWVSPCGPTLMDCRWLASMGRVSWSISKVCPGHRECRGWKHTHPLYLSSLGKELSLRIVTHCKPWDFQDKWPLYPYQNASWENDEQYCPEKCFREGPKCHRSCRVHHFGALGF